LPGSFAVLPHRPPDAPTKTAPDGQCGPACLTAAYREARETATRTPEKRQPRQERTTGEHDLMGWCTTIRPGPVRCGGVLLPDVEGGGEHAAAVHGACRLYRPSPRPPGPGGACTVTAPQTSAPLPGAVRGVSHRMAASPRRVVHDPSVPLLISGRATGDCRRPLRNSRRWQAVFGVDAPTEVADAFRGRVDSSGGHHSSGTPECRVYRLAVVPQGTP